MKAAFRVRLAFAIFKVFPHGGVARDLRKLVAACLVRGHRVRVYAMVWEGDDLPGAEVVLLPCRGLRSHVRQRKFAGRVAREHRRNRDDLLIGMNKMPGLDVYFAADSCFEDKARTQRPWAYRLTPRYRHFAAFERAVFEESASTRILTIAPAQADVFRRIYQTPRHRLHALPPGIERDRAAGDANVSHEVRAEFGIGHDGAMLLFVGSGFVKKGLARLLTAVADLPSEVRETVTLVVAGQDAAGRFVRQARALGIAGRVRFAGGRDDVPALLAAADALALPALDEAAGMVILEAAIAGTPVLATENCGYAHFIAEHDTGVVTPCPFDQRRFDADLLRLLTAPQRAQWAHNGRRLAKDERLYAMPQRAAELLGGFASPQQVLAFIAFDYRATDPRYRDLVPLALACRSRGVAVRVYACAERSTEEVPKLLPESPSHELSSANGAVAEQIDLCRVAVSAMTLQGQRARFRRWVIASLGNRSRWQIVDFDRPGGIASALGVEDFDLPPGTGAAPATPDTGRDLTRDHLGWADKVVFCLFGGDLVEQGIERLLLALGKLPVALKANCAVLALGALAPQFRTALTVLELADQTAIVDDGSMAWADALAAADVFVSLPYGEAANGWVFDAMSFGCAVLTHGGVTEAEMVIEADAGIVLDAPFQHRHCERAVVDVMNSDEQRLRWQEHAAGYGSEPARHGRADALAERLLVHVSQGGNDSDQLAA